MTRELDFNLMLDAKPTDWQTRLVFADWLDDRGDPRASGYRALAIQQRRPLKGRHLDTDTWWWHSHPNVNALDNFHNIIPADWFSHLPSGEGNTLFWPLFRAQGGLKTRQQCEDALALAFAKLPQERQVELLTPLKTSTKEES